MHTLVIVLLLALSSAAAAKEAKAHAQADAKADAKAEAKTPQVVQGEALAKKIQALYKKVQDFSASFSQTYTYTAFDRTDVRKGIVEVKRPGLVRWEYSEPEKKLLLLDGKDFWQYVPEDNAVSVKRGLKGNEASAAFSFLWGKGDLLSEFDAATTDLPAGLTSVPKAKAVLLVPKKQGGSVNQVVFAVSDKGEVLASVLTDAQGNVNRIVFADQKTNVKPDAKRFVFEVPKGATVQELP